MENNNLWIISIIAIVAIVGMTFMFSGNKVSYAPQGADYIYEGAQGDMAGQATRRSLNTQREIIPERELEQIIQTLKNTQFVFASDECGGNNLIIHNNKTICIDPNNQDALYAWYSGLNCLFCIATLPAQDAGCGWSMTSAECSDFKKDVGTLWNSVW